MRNKSLPIDIEFLVSTHIKKNASQVISVMVSSYHPKNNILSNIEFPNKILKFYWKKTNHRTTGKYYGQVYLWYSTDSKIIPYPEDSYTAWIPLNGERYFVVDFLSYFRRSRKIFIHQIFQYFILIKINIKPIMNFHSTPYNKIILVMTTSLTRVKDKGSSGKYTILCIETHHGFHL